jgi:hypothetical protein
MISLHLSVILSAFSASLNCQLKSFLQKIDRTIELKEGEKFGFGLEIRNRKFEIYSKIIEYLRAI